ncbi:hypothetical protein HHX47_DHR4001044 [Lentinula edodes]|nr:hypothetical protein HHX47_DHR4001044 [Lentinula edodes]
MIPLSMIVYVDKALVMTIGWDTLQIGLAYGTALLIGAFLGETAGGWVVDSIMEIGMTFAFYAIVLGEALGGYHFLFIFFACVGSILAFIPILVLMWKGEAIRAAERRIFVD